MIAQDSVQARAGEKERNPSQRTGQVVFALIRRGEYVQIKPVRDITIGDLAAVPVWQLVAGDPETEAQAEPTELREVPEDHAGRFIVVTSFVLRDGSTVIGFCSPQHDGGVECTAPVIITGGGHVPLWFDGEPSEHQLAEMFQKLMRSPEQVFPLTMRTGVPVGGKSADKKLLGVSGPRPR
jgi:hypothetical protein